MHGEKKQTEVKTDTGIFTVDGQKYYVLFTEAVDLKRKGEIISRIKTHVKANNISFIEALEPNYIMVTSNVDAFHKRKKVKNLYEATKAKPKFEGKVVGHNWLFYIRSNVEIGQKMLGYIATEIERVLYETANNKRSAEHTIKTMTNSDYVRIIRKGGHYIVYIISDVEGEEEL